MDKLNHPINLNHITPGQAIRGTVEMWTDMKDTLGESPTAEQRYAFKRDWLLEHDYIDPFCSNRHMSSVSSDCFLCECAEAQWERDNYRHLRCAHCPINWPKAGQFTPLCRSNILDYSRAPISDILAYIQDEKNLR